MTEIEKIKAEIKGQYTCFNCNGEDIDYQLLKLLSRIKRIGYDYYFLLTCKDCKAHLEINIDKDFEKHFKGLYGFRCQKSNK
jgi:transcription elongation factor Elf1